MGCVSGKSTEVATAPNIRTSLPTLPKASPGGDDASPNQVEIPTYEAGSIPDMPPLTKIAAEDAVPSQEVSPYKEGSIPPIPPLTKIGVEDEHDDKESGIGESDMSRQNTMSPEDIQPIDNVALISAAEVDDNDETGAGRPLTQNTGPDVVGDSKSQRIPFDGSSENNVQIGPEGNEHVDMQTKPLDLSKDNIGSENNNNATQEVQGQPDEAAVNMANGRVYDPNEKQSGKGSVRGSRRNSLHDLDEEWNEDEMGWDEEGEWQGDEGWGEDEGWDGEEDTTWHEAIKEESEGEQMLKTDDVLESVSRALTEMEKTKEGGDEKSMKSVVTMVTNDNIDTGSIRDHKHDKEKPPWNDDIVSVNLTGRKSKVGGLASVAEGRKSSNSRAEITGSLHQNEVVSVDNENSVSTDVKDNFARLDRTSEAIIDPVINSLPDASVQSTEFKIGPTDGEDEDEEINTSEVTRNLVQNDTGNESAVTGFENAQSYPKETVDNERVHESGIMKDFSRPKTRSSVHGTTTPNNKSVVVKDSERPKTRSSMRERSANAIRTSTRADVKPENNNKPKPRNVSAHHRPNVAEAAKIEAMMKTKEVEAGQGMMEMLKRVGDWASRERKDGDYQMEGDEDPEENPLLRIMRMRDGMAESLRMYREVQMMKVYVQKLNESIEMVAEQEGVDLDAESDDEVTEMMKELEGLVSEANDILGIETEEDNKRGQESEAGEREDVEEKDEDEDNPEDGEHHEDTQETNENNGDNDSEAQSPRTNVTATTTNTVEMGVQVEIEDEEKAEEMKQETIRLGLKVKQSRNNLEAKVDAIRNVFIVDGEEGATVTGDEDGKHKDKDTFGVPTEGLSEKDRAASTKEPSRDNLSSRHSVRSSRNSARGSRNSGRSSRNSVRSRGMSNKGVNQIGESEEGQSRTTITRARSAKSSSSRVSRLRTTESDNTKDIAESGRELHSRKSSGKTQNNKGFGGTDEQRTINAQESDNEKEEQLCASSAETRETASPSEGSFVIDMATMLDVADCLEDIIREIEKSDEQVAVEILEKIVTELEQPDENIVLECLDKIIVSIEQEEEMKRVLEERQLYYNNMMQGVAEAGKARMAQLTDDMNRNIREYEEMAGVDEEMRQRILAEMKASDGLTLADEEDENGEEEEEGNVTERSNIEEMQEISGVDKCMDWINDVEPIEVSGDSLADMDANDGQKLSKLVLPKEEPDAIEEMMRYIQKTSEDIKRGAAFDDQVPEGGSPPCITNIVDEGSKESSDDGGDVNDDVAVQQVSEAARARIAELTDEMTTAIRAYEANMLHQAMRDSSKVAAQHPPPRTPEVIGPPLDTEEMTNGMRQHESSRFDDAVKRTGGGRDAAVFAHDDMSEVPDGNKMASELNITAATRKEQSLMQDIKDETRRVIDAQATQRPSNSADDSIEETETAKEKFDKAANVARLRIAELTEEMTKAIRIYETIQKIKQKRVQSNNEDEGQTNS